jgi:Domain of unknown function (DUF5655)
MLTTSQVWEQPEPGETMASQAVAQAETRDWSQNRQMWVRVLENRTGQGVAHWRQRIEHARIRDESSLRAWLAKRGVTGYAQSLLVMERFGYPDFIVSSAGELIDGQYRDRQELRPIYERVVRAALNLGEVVIQARKTYVSLVSPRRTFARVQPTTRQRVDLGLRLDRQRPIGRLQPSKIHETMQLQIGFTLPAEVDDEVVRWLKRAYQENC